MAKSEAEVYGEEAVVRWVREGGGACSGIHDGQQLGKNIINRRAPWPPIPTASIYLGLNYAYGTG